MVKKLTGSVLEVFKAQGHEQSFIDDFARNRGKSENIDTIGKDLPRTSLADFARTFDDFAEDIQHDSIYEEHYIQGNLDGGLALDIYDIYKGQKLKKLYAEVDSMPNSPEKEKKNEDAIAFFTSWTRDRESLRFAYRDDAGSLCAVGLVFNKELPNNWALQIYRNTVAPLSERTTTLFAQGELVSTDKAANIEVSSLTEEIRLALGSEKINALLSGLFNEKGEVSVQKVEEVEQRLGSNQNIDNRDVKKIKLEELINQANKILPDNSILLTYLDELKLRSSSEINFFKEGNFEETLEKLFIKISNQLVQIDNQEEAEISFLNTKLIYYAIQLELKALPLHNEKLEVLRGTYLDQAKKLRDLSSNDPLSEKDIYKDMTFFELNKKIEDLAPKRAKLNQFVKKAKQRCDNDTEALAYVKELESNINKDIESYTEDSFRYILAVSSRQFDKYIVEKEYNDAWIIHSKIIDFASQLKSHAETFTDNARSHMRQGFLDKSEALGNLSPEEVKRYKTVDWDTILSETIAEINDAQFKKKFLEDLTRFADELAGSAPSFLAQRIKDKSKDMEVLPAEQLVETYKDKKFNAIASEMVTNIFKDEQTKQKKEIQNSLNEALKVAKPSAPEDQGFFRRNRTSLIIGVLGVLAFISLVLTLTGVLAPLGIALGTATAVTASLAGAVTAGAVVVGAGTQVMNNEIQFSDDRNKYLKQDESFRAKAASLKTDYAKAVEKFNASHSEIQSKFMTEHFKDESDSIPDADLPVVEVGVNVDPTVTTDVTLKPNEKQSTTISELELGAETLLKQVIPLLSTGEAATKKGLDTIVREPIVSSKTLGSKVPQEQELDETTVLDRGSTSVMKQ